MVHFPQPQVESVPDPFYLSNTTSFEASYAPPCRDYRRISSKTAGFNLAEVNFVMRQLSTNNAVRKESRLPHTLEPQYRASLSYIKTRMEVLRAALRDASEVFAFEILSIIGPLEPQFLESGDLDGGVDFYELVRDFEISLIRRALYHSSGSQKGAATLLSLKATTLNAKMKAYGIRSKPGVVNNTTKMRSPMA